MTDRERLRVRRRPMPLGGERQRRDRTKRFRRIRPAPYTSSSEADCAPSAMAASGRRPSSQNSSAIQATPLTNDSTATMRARNRAVNTLLSASLKSVAASNIPAGASSPEKLTSNARSSSGLASSSTPTAAAAAICCSAKARSRNRRRPAWLRVVTSSGTKRRMATSSPSAQMMTRNSVMLRASTNLPYSAGPSRRTVRTERPRYTKIIASLLAIIHGTPETASREKYTDDSPSEPSTGSGDRGGLPGLLIGPRALRVEGVLIQS